MNVAIMQPYFFPYLGYFQLIAASDVFVLHDDVQYIKAGWVNRNRILFNGESRMITLPVQKDSYELPINARMYVRDEKARKDILNLIKQAYLKAPFFPQVFPFLNELLMYGDCNVARYNENLVRLIADYLGLTCKIITSSGMDKNNSLAGEQRVLEMCKQLEATRYINPQGGQSLYDTATFRDRGIDLRFIVMRPASYNQGTAAFIPYLSIIDALMWLGSVNIQHHLAEFDLIETSTGCCIQ
jgi:hypothetical protein